MGKKIVAVGDTTVSRRKDSDKVHNVIRGEAFRHIIRAGITRVVPRRNKYGLYSLVPTFDPDEGYAVQRKLGRPYVTVEFPAKAAGWEPFHFDETFHALTRVYREGTISLGWAQL